LDQQGWVLILKLEMMTGNLIILDGDMVIVNAANAKGTGFIQRTFLAELKSQSSNMKKKSNAHYLQF